MSISHILEPGVKPWAKVYLEEANFPVKTYEANLSGIVTVPTPITVSYQKIGNMVTLNVPQIFIANADLNTNGFIDIIPVDSMPELFPTGNGAQTSCVGFDGDGEDAICSVTCFGSNMEIQIKYGASEAFAKAGGFDIGVLYGVTITYLTD